MWAPAHEHDARRVLAVVLFLLDLVACLGPMLLRASKRIEDPTHWPALVALAVCCWLSLYLVGGYRLRDLLQGKSRGLLLLAGVVGALTGLTAYKLLYHDGDETLRFTAIAAAAIAGFGLWAAISRNLCTLLLRRREVGAKLLFLGTPTQARELASTLAKAGPVPSLTIFHEPPIEDALGYAAIDDHLAGRVRAVVLAVPVDSLPPAAVSALIHAKLADIPVIGPSQLVERVCERTPVMLGDHAWMLEQGSLNPGRSAFYTGLKRVLDLTAASVGLLVCSPLMLGTALAVKLTSRGPIFFTQLREGRYKQPFRIVKFRTMRTDAEQAGAQWATKNDPRVTPIGAFLRKSRLDELPQFWNVLVGDMSLVGPRPERPEFNQMLVERIPWYDLRHLAKPGLTGWAQVCYPYGASVEDAIAKLEYEVYWMKKASLRFDLRIILRTIAVVVGLRGR
jgi:exopolysaccharide biosynthesis polyprenyl glycosylphosphotransferase